MSRFITNIVIRNKTERDEKTFTVYRYEFDPEACDLKETQIEEKVEFQVIVPVVQPVTEGEARGVK